MGQLAVDEVQHGRREAIGVVDQHGLVCQVICGTVLSHRLAGCVGDKDAELGGLQQADGGAEAGGGVAPEGPGAQDALPPLAVRVGEEEGQYGAGDCGEDPEQAGKLTGGELWAGVARHGLPFPCLFLSCPVLSCPILSYPVLSCPVGDAWVRRRRRRRDDSKAG